MNFNLSNYLQFLVAPCGQVVRGFVSIYIVNKYLGLSAVGTWAQVLSCHAFMYLIVNFNLTQSMSRYYPKLLKDNSNVYSISNAVFITNVIFILIYSLILLPFSDGILDFVYSSNIKIGYSLLIFLFFTENLYNVIYCHYRSTLQSKKQAYFASFRLGFELIFFLPFLMIYTQIYSIDIYMFLFLYTLFVFTAVLISLFFLGEINKIIFSGVSFRENSIQFANYGLRLLPQSFSFWIISQSDRWFIAGKFDHETLGYYFISTRFFMIFLFLVSPFHSIYTYIAAEDSSEITSYYKVVKIAVVVAALFSFVLYLTFPIVLMLFNLDAKSYISVYNLVPFMLFSGFLFAIYSILNTFRLINNPGVVSIEWMVLAFLYISFLFLLPPYFGIKGVIFAQILSYFLIIISVFARLKFNASN